MKIIQFPLTKVTLGFVLGILVNYYLKCGVTIALFGLLTTSFIFAITYYFTEKKGLNSIFFGFSTYFLSFCIGLSALTLHTHYFQKDNYAHNESLFNHEKTLVVVVREKIKKTNFNQRYIVIIKEIDTKPQTGRLILNIRENCDDSTFEIGSQLKFKTTLIKNSLPKNPYQFNYSEYLNNKQIYAQVYCDKSEIKKSPLVIKDIWYYSSKLRSRIIQNLKKNKFNETELNVAVALIMGQQQAIDPEIVQDYQYAGAVHILSVSGLHIGFILLFITFLLKPLPNTTQNSFIKLLIIILALILFGIIAGLAPSVVRSIVMFSFVAIGKHLKRADNIYHTLLVSILIILLFEPYFLFDVGFQLSYVALFFIVWLQPLLVLIWSPKNRIFKYIWDILTVSFAAQIGTLPLSIYYFHQFPGLFFITNIVIIPIISFIMLIGVLVMFLAAMNTIPLFLSKTLEWNIYYLNKIIHFIASAEHFVIKNIPFTTTFLILSYIVIITTIIWLKKPSFNTLKIACTAIILIQLNYINHKLGTQKEKEWIIFNSKKESLITSRNGQKTTLFTNNSNNNLKNSLITTYTVGTFSYITATKRIQNFEYFNGNKILIIDSTGIYPENINPYLILLTQNTKINLDRLIEKLNPKIIVADATNYTNVVQFWKESCKKQKIPFYSTSEKGFFRLR
jgi:competence protein ComEC